MADKWLSCAFANLDEACRPLSPGTRDVIEAMLYDGSTVLQPDDVFSLNIHDMCQRVWKVCGFPKMKDLPNYFGDLIDSFRATGSPAIPTPSMHFWFTLVEDTSRDAFVTSATARAEKFYTEGLLDPLQLEQSLAHDDLLVYLFGSERHALYMTRVRAAVATQIPAYAAQILAMLKNGQASSFIKVIDLATADTKEAFASQSLTTRGQPRCLYSAAQIMLVAIAAPSKHKCSQ